MRAGCFQSRYSHYHDMGSICQIRTGFSIQTQHFCQYHSHKHPKSQYMHAPKPHQACCVDTVDQGKCTFSATQSVFVFIPESDGTDTAREIRYKTHRTYLAKSAFFIFPQACEYAGVILVNAILVLLKQKKKVCCWDRYGLRVLTCSFLSPWLRMLFMSLCSRCKPPYRDHTLGLLVDKRPSTVVFRLDSSFQCSFLEGNREARRHLTKREEVQRFWCWQCSWLIH